MQQRITDDLDALLGVLPPDVNENIRKLDGLSDILEVVMDLGRPPEARFPGNEAILASRDVLEDDLEYVVARIGVFGDDNRAGIERTLHRISAIRNRTDRIVGLTCRIGRAVYGTIGIVEDLIQSGKSILFMGRPGVGKTTMLREAARVLADDMKKRVIIVDTSNEIAGDGDIPHPAIGRARRMQVKSTSLQHTVMIEAVENHMPEVIVIDEIGTELEALAARTIAERGVQLIATAHGNTLENLMMNPSLSDLIGGIQTVTLSDEEARRRGTQKSVLERKAPPTFEVIVEIQNWHRVAVHDNVTDAVDAILRGRPLPPELRFIDEEGELRKEMSVGFHTAVQQKVQAVPPASGPIKATKLYPYGLSHKRLEQAIAEMQLPVMLVEHLEQADIVLTLKNYYRKKPQPLRDAEARSIPVYVLKNNTVLQMEQALASLYDVELGVDEMSVAMREAEEAIEQVLKGEENIELSPQTSYIRKLQHQLAERHRLGSRSRGRDPYRRVQIYKGE